MCFNQNFFENIENIRKRLNRNNRNTRKGDVMTGQEFLEKIRNIKEITGVEWEIKGEPLDADIAKIKVSADEKEFSVLVGYPKTTMDIEWMQHISLNLVLQKIEQQTGKKNPYISSDPVRAINYAIGLLKGGKDYGRTANHKD